MGGKLGHQPGCCWISPEHKIFKQLETKTALFEMGSKETKQEFDF
jgi:hypothetical protein